jgi:hypothetical protein
LKLILVAANALLRSAEDRIYAYAKEVLWFGLKFPKLNEIEIAASCTADPEEKRPEPDQTCCAFRLEKPPCVTLARLSIEPRPR